jgi:hypothetical protein
VILSALALVAATAAPSAAPTASPLKVIIRVHSRALCSTLTQRIAPAVAGLMKDDEVIALGQKGVAKMGADATAHASTRIDALGIENVVQAIVRNTEQIDDILDSPENFSLDPKSDDDRTADAIKAQLLVVLTRQKVVLNALNGLIQTEDLGRMQTEGLSGIPSATSKSTYGPTESEQSALQAAGLGVDPHEIDTRMLNSDLAGMTPYGRLATVLKRYDVHTAEIEAVAAVGITQVASACGGTTPP